jgi:lipoyl(octanoyl) transferase
VAHATASWTWLGRVPYEPALQLQEQIREDILAGRACDTLLLLEHPPVITLGRSAQPAHVLFSPARLQQQGIALHQTTRGGDVTFHGPGQLVGYPIFRLRRGVRAHIESMANAIIEWLARFEVSAQWRSQTPGVWVGNEKICAFGIHVRHRIAIHGFALNLSTDMQGFSAIVPCGLRDAGVTSLSRLLGRAPDPETAARDLIGLFEKHFGVQLKEARVSSVLNRTSP